MSEGGNGKEQIFSLEDMEREVETRMGRAEEKTGDFVEVPGENKNRETLIKERPHDSTHKPSKEHKTEWDRENAERMKQASKEAGESEIQEALADWEEPLDETEETESFSDNGSEKITPELEADLINWFKETGGREDTISFERWRRQQENGRNEQKGAEVYEAYVTRNTEREKELKKEEINERKKRQHSITGNRHSRRP